MGAASRGLVSRYTQISNINIVYASVVALSACVLPLILSDYWIFQCTMVMVYSIALLGLNLLTGYNGQISLGHGAFYAIGAYATAILAERIGVPYVMAIIFSAGICFVVGYLFGLPALRLEGLYLALATFALALAVPQLLRYKGIEDWTGGSGGLLVTKPAPPTWVNLDSDRWLYFVTLGFLIIAFLAVRNLLTGPMGRAIVAIRDNPLAAEALGVDAARTKSVTFGISACLAGLAGSLGALAVQYVAPDTFSLSLSLTFLIGIVVGGLASISGAIFGAIFVEFLPDIADQLSKSASAAIYGAVLIAIAYSMPTGVAGALAGLRRWRRK